MLILLNKRIGYESKCKSCLSKYPSFLVKIPALFQPQLLIFKAFSNLSVYSCPPVCMPSFHHL